MSSQQAKNFHSITIGTKNTWDDWHLVPTSRPLVSPPPPITSYADLVGGDGSLDLTVSLTTKPTYGNRSGSWDFYVINPGQIVTAEAITALWATRYSEIMNYLHGKSFDVILDDDPNYFYTGRLAVTSWRSEKDNSTITINYNFDPYKRGVSDHSIKRF